MEIGDLIRVLRVPDSVNDSTGFATRSTLERCVGRVFPIVSFNDLRMIELEIGELLGKPSYMESIWIEPDCVEPVAG